MTQRKKSATPSGVKLRISQQGAPLVQPSAVVTHQYPDIVCLTIDMDSKWCEVSGFGDGLEGPDISIDATKRIKTSCGRLHRSKKGSTVVQFPDHIGWSVFTAVCSRYTVRVVLTKDKEVPHPLVS
jgi:hypothetical protein